MNVMFFLEEVEDVYIRDNFRRLQNAMGVEAVLQADFKFFEITATDSVLNFDYVHNLGYQPKDVMLLSVTDEESVTFHYDAFTKTTIQFTTTGACTFRCFVGRYREGGLR